MITAKVINKKEYFLMCKLKIVAAAKALEVCPDGKEKELGGLTISSIPSMLIKGLSLSIMFFNATSPIK
ncbi:hypothetical protein D3C76_1711500 [compost metagenome]